MAFFINSATISKYTINGFYRLVFLRLSCDGHRIARENLVGQKPPSPQFSRPSSVRHDMLYHIGISGGGAFVASCSTGDKEDLPSTGQGKLFSYSTEVLRKLH